MRAVALAVACVVGCGGEDVEGPTRGTVTVITKPGARVDFMSVITDRVIITDTTDASGRVSTIIDRGDRAVIVFSPEAPSTSEIVVLDELIPEQEYYWTPDEPSGEIATSVIVDWPVNAADHYQVDSRCGSSIGPPPTIVAVCEGGDALLVSAFDSADRLLSSAYQPVIGPTLNQMITITAPFAPPRDVSVALQGAAPDASQVFGTLYTKDGVTFQVEPQLSTVEPTRFPDLDGMLRMHAKACAPGGSLKNVIDQRPIRDAVTLDFAERPLPNMTSSATFHAETRIYDWTITGDGFPDAVVVGLRTISANYLTVIAPYRGPRVHVPVLPGDLPEPAVTPEVIPLLVASPGGYPAAVSGFGRQNDPAHPSIEVFTSTYYPPCG